ncbi:MAG TPA: hypothetical protein VFL16_10220 [Steroidobacteraceae bacterium]|nr:hypothetical protein [Steroidobacteraceae bacterium]
MATLLHPTTIAFVLFFLALLAESWFSWRFLRGARKYHPDLWNAMGRRTIWTDSDLISAIPTIAFLWKRKYARTSTSEVVQYCESYRLPVVISWAAAGAFVLLFFTSLLTLGWKLPQ